MFQNQRLPLCNIYRASQGQWWSFSSHFFCKLPLHLHRGPHRHPHHHHCYFQNSACSASCKQKNLPFKFIIRFFESINMFLFHYMHSTWIYTIFLIFQHVFTEKCPAFSVKLWASWGKLRKGFTKICTWRKLFFPSHNSCFSIMERKDIFLARKK